MWKLDGEGRARRFGGEVSAGRRGEAGRTIAPGFSTRARSMALLTVFLQWRPVARARGRFVQRRRRPYTSAVGVPGFPPARDEVPRCPSERSSRTTVAATRRTASGCGCGRALAARSSPGAARRAARSSRPDRSERRDGRVRRRPCAPIGAPVPRRQGGSLCRARLGEHRVRRRPSGGRCRRAQQSEARPPGGMA